MPTFVLKGPIEPDGHFKLSEADAHHLTRVLRLKAGEEFLVLSPEGRRGTARLELSGKHWLGRLLHDENSISIQCPLWLGLGLIRWPRLEWVMEKITELGVTRLTPLHLERCRLPASEQVSPNKLKRLQKISAESLKQCERGTAVQLDAVSPLKDFLAAAAAAGPAQKWIFLERSEGPTFHPKHLDAKQLQIILIGPEGGFAPKESELALASGFKIASLGPHPLRAETAAMYAACLVHCAFLPPEVKP